VSAASEYAWHAAAGELSHDYLRPAVLHRAAALLATTALGPRRVFDAGCGNGALLGGFKAADYELAGCDLSDSGVRIARSSLGSGVRIEKRSVCDDLAAEFGSEWDLVIATEVIEHVYAPRDMVRRMAELLRPGGWLLLSTPYHGYLKNLALAASGAMDAHFTALWDGGHIKFWSRRTLTSLLEEQGFQDIGFAGVGRLPWLWKSMLLWARRL
jgi:2-polyprenyl-6-hydroxyphenyl methylase/3-demethylubiquinone-9 3-methyltransferase